MAAKRYFNRVLAGSTDDFRLTAKVQICVAMTLLDVQAWQQGKFAPTKGQVFWRRYHHNEAAKLGYGKCPALLHFLQAVELKSVQLCMWTIFDERNKEIDRERRKAAEQAGKEAQSICLCSRRMWNPCEHRESYFEM